MKPILIGQAPGPRSDPEHPLSGRCGERLADLCGLSLPQFLDAFERANLIKRFPGKSGKGDHFPINEARKEVVELLIFGRLAGRRVVLLGDHVATAFGFPAKQVERLRWNFVDGSGLSIAFCPHPSGISHWWNDKANVAKARRFWRELAKDA